MQTKKELPVISVQTQKKWRNWLEKSYTNSNGVWLQLYKKDSGVKSINHEEALEEALCFGWIDGQAKSYDEKSYLQKFTPRRKRSTWSKRNINIIERLIGAGKMHPSGLAKVEKAKADGRWENAYDSPANMKIPDDLITLLSANPKAFEFFKTLNKTNTYSIVWRLQTAKRPETRQKRIKAIIEMLGQGKNFTRRKY